MNQGGGHLFARTHVWARPENRWPQPQAVKLTPDFPSDGRSGRLDSHQERHRNTLVDAVSASPPHLRASAGLRRARHAVFLGLTTLVAAVALAARGRAEAQDADSPKYLPVPGMVGPLADGRWIVLVQLPDGGLGTAPIPPPSFLDGGQPPRPPDDKHHYALLIDGGFVALVQRPPAPKGDCDYSRGIYGQSSIDNGIQVTRRQGIDAAGNWVECTNEPPPQWGR